MKCVFHVNNLSKKKTSEKKWLSSNSTGNIIALTYLMICTGQDDIHGYQIRKESR